MFGITYNKQRREWLGVGFTSTWDGRKIWGFQRSTSTWKVSDPDGSEGMSLNNFLSFVSYNIVGL